MRPLASISSFALAIGITATTLLGIGQPLSSTSSSAPGGVPLAHAQASTFQDTFTGRPSNPTPFRSANWDVLAHSRDVGTWQQPESMMGGHGNDCAAHPAEHLVSQYPDTVYQCNDHLMTAINASGYGAIYLTPNQLVDFSSGEATINFDLSTLRTSQRDWIDLWITPYEENMPAPLNTWLPDLTGLPKRGIHIQMSQFNGTTIFAGEVIRNFTETSLPGNWWTGYESFLTPSAVRRDTFQLKLSKSGLKFGMPGYNFSWLDTQFPELDWSRGVVQFGHHSYTPLKDCGMPSCSANTWHWDNVQVSPAVPFTILPGDRARATASASTVTFAGPAPADSHLRFLGIGGNLQASLDGGPWMNFAPRQTTRAPEEAFKPYWLPVPAGTRQVAFRGSDWYGGPWAINDPAIWSLTTPGGAPAPVATPTAPAVTATATAPAVTATATAAAATLTATPTSTPAEQAATATPTATAPTATAPAVTATATATQIPVTATLTSTVPAATATATSTQVAATPTPTSTAPAGGGLLPNGSLKLAGSAHVTVPNAPELALTGDWTAELWFKDEYATAATFHHGPQALLTKGDTDWDPDVPLWARIEWGVLVVGDRRGWNEQSVRYELSNAGVAAAAWHHLAVTKSAATRRIQVILDGQVVVDQVLPGQNPPANSKGLTIGRNGRQHNWRGKLDDIRIWNVVRPVSEIAATFRTELTNAPAGLVANWKLNETAGASIADSAGSPQPATLKNGGGAWTTDVHP